MATYNRAELLGTSRSQLKRYQSDQNVLEFPLLTDLADFVSLCLELCTGVQQTEDRHVQSKGQGATDPVRLPEQTGLAPGCCPLAVFAHAAVHLLVGMSPAPGLALLYWGCNKHLCLQCAVTVHLHSMQIWDQLQAFELQPALCKGKGQSVHCIVGPLLWLEL